MSNSPLSFVDPGGQFQAGVGCNVGYVMCMNGGDNTSGGGGGGSGRSTETVTFRTFNFQIGINFAWVPISRDPFGIIFGRGGGGGINDDRSGGILSNVFFEDRYSVRFNLISNFFISITSSTGTRVIQTTEEEQSPSSVPMGVGAQQGQVKDFTWAIRQLADKGLVPEEILYDSDVLQDHTNKEALISTNGTIKVVGSLSAAEMLEAGGGWQIIDGSHTDGVIKIYRGATRAVFEDHVGIVGMQLTGPQNLVQTIYHEYMHYSGIKNHGNNRDSIDYKRWARKEGKALRGWIDGL